MILKICPLTTFELVFILVWRSHERLYRTCRTCQKKDVIKTFILAPQWTSFQRLQRHKKMSTGRNFAQWVDNKKHTRVCQKTGELDHLLDASVQGQEPIFEILGNKLGAGRCLSSK